MMSQDFSVQPPRIATWLIGLFTSDNEAEAIPGDLLEEFSHLASKAGVAIARRWYWRQTGKTITHLAGGAFRSAPRAPELAIVLETLSASIEGHANAPGTGALAVDVAGLA